MPKLQKKPTNRLAKVRAFYQDLKNRFHHRHLVASSWLADKGLDVETLKYASRAAATATTLAGMIISSKPVDAQVAEQLKALDKHKNELLEVSAEERKDILQKMQTLLKNNVGHLPKEEELYLEQQLTDMLGFEVTAELDGHRLNHSLGIMGGEQHLKRFPSDSLAQHDAYQQAGIAPARGAFGWFTQNGELTAEAIQREKYYFAVQTLYLPDWNQNYQQLKPWYQYRKMVAINPANGKAVVAVVGDAGPALWVGKQFGGSPEVIKEGQVWSKEARGRVILYFINDPENKVPLGPRDLTV